MISPRAAKDQGIACSARRTSSQQRISRNAQEVRAGTTTVVVDGGNRLGQAESARSETTNARGERRHKEGLCRDEHEQPRTRNSPQR